MLQSATGNRPLSSPFLTASTQLGHFALSAFCVRLKLTTTSRHLFLRKRNHRQMIAFAIMGLDSGRVEQLADVRSPEGRNLMLWRPLVPTLFMNGSTSRIVWRHGRSGLAIKSIEAFSFGAGMWLPDPCPENDLLAGT